MALNNHKRAVGVFSSRREAEHALDALNNSGFAMRKVSIIAKDADKKDDIAGVDVQSGVGNKADEGAATGAATGATIGGITGLLVGLGTLAIPGVGPIMLAGEIATTLATTLAGAGIGAATGGLLGALIGLGIPEERAKVYSDRVSRGDYLVVVDGTDEEIAKAEAILTTGGIQEFGIYDAPGVDTTRSDYVADTTTTTTTTRADYVEPATPVVDTTRTNPSSGVTTNDPKVTIIDRRDETR